MSGNLILLPNTALQVALAFGGPGSRRRGLIDSDLLQSQRFQSSRFRITRGISLFRLRQDPGLHRRSVLEAQERIVSINAGLRL